MPNSTAVEYEDEAEATPITAAAGSGGKEAVSPVSRKVAYDVLVVNAERHGTGVSAYLTYEVRTKMTGGAFGEREFAVRRRYADFLWLRNTMAGNYHHALIPALSDKEKLPSKLGGKYESKVLEARCRMLQTFLHRVCSHPALSQSKDLLAFLEAKVFALDTAPSLMPQNVVNSLFSWGREAQRAGNILLGQYQEDPEDVQNQNLLALFDKFEQQGGLLLDSVKKISKRTQGVGQDLSESVPALEALSQSETNSELAHALKRCAAATSEMGDTWQEQSQADDLAVVEPLRDLVLLVGAAKDVLKNRQAAVIDILEIRENKARILRELEQAQANQKPSGQQKQKTAFELFRETMVLDTPVDTIKKLQLQKAECEAAAQRADRRWKEASAVTKREMDRFDKMRVCDLKTLLIEHAKSQADFHRKMQAQWEALLPQLECVAVIEPDPPQGSIFAAFGVGDSEAATPTASKVLQHSTTVDVAFGGSAPAAGEDGLDDVDEGL